MLKHVVVVLEIIIQHLYNFRRRKITTTLVQYAMLRLNTKIFLLLSSSSSSPTLNRGLAWSAACSTGRTVLAYNITHCKEQHRIAAESVMWPEAQE